MILQGFIFYICLWIIHFEESEETHKTLNEEHSPEEESELSDRTLLLFPDNIQTNVIGIDKTNYPSSINTAWSDLMNLDDRYSNLRSSSVNNINYSLKKNYETNRNKIIQPFVPKEVKRVSQLFVHPSQMFPTRPKYTSGSETHAANLRHENRARKKARFPLIKKKEHKNYFNDLEQQLNYNEELYNTVDNILPMANFNLNKETFEKKANSFRHHKKHHQMPYLGSLRESKNKHFKIMNFVHKKIIDDIPKSDNVEEKIPSKNLMLFGTMDDIKILQQFRNCGSHISIDLLRNYNLEDLTYSLNHKNKRMLIVLVNVMRSNTENYEVVLHRIKLIVNHVLSSFNNLSIINLYPYEEQFVNETLGIVHSDNKRSLLNLNDQLLDHCTQNFPACVVENNFDSILQSLLNVYRSKKQKYFDRNLCSFANFCGKFPANFPYLSNDGSPGLKSPRTQLQTVSEALCMTPHYRLVEFVLNVPDNTHQKENGSVSNPGPKLGKTNRVYAQTGLVLHDILPLDLKKYDKNRPPKYEGHATIVYFHVTVLSVDSINEESMTYVTDIFLAQSWRDHRLRLPENMTEEYRILDVEWLHNIWRPDCFFKNAKQVTFHEMSVPNHYLWLYHDKTLLYMAKLTLVLSCAMQFETYPHDTQICSMMIESLSHTTHDLIFKWNETDPLVVNPDIELPQLDISRNNTEDCTLTYSTGNFTCLAVVFNLRRRLGYHLFHTYIPSAITVVMSWISFWIKPEAIPARVTLGVTSLLTLATQNQQSQSSLPPVSYIKAIDVWMSSCTVFVFASLLEFGIVNNFMNAEPLTKDMTGYSIDDYADSDERKFPEEMMLNGYGRARSRSRSVVRSRSPGRPSYVVTSCSGKEIAVHIDKFSRIFFPLSFIILNISYWTTYGAL